MFSISVLKNVSKTVLYVYVHNCNIIKTLSKLCLDDWMSLHLDELIPTPGFPGDIYQLQSMTVSEILQESAASCFGNNYCTLYQSKVWRLIPSKTEEGYLAAEIVKLEVPESQFIFHLLISLNFNYG